MKKIMSLLLVLIVSINLEGQTIQESYKKHDFKKVIQSEEKANTLSSEELYDLGYSFFRLGQDEKAIKYYDLSIQKGFKDPFIFFFKGLSLNYLKKYDEAIPLLEKAVKAYPENQEYMNELGISYFNLERYEKALEIFKAATKLENTYQAPFYYVAKIYDIQEKYIEAEKYYYEALKHISKDDTYYVSTLESLSILEYSTLENYLNAIDINLKAFAIKPLDYTIGSRLMKSYNAAKQYYKADSIFNLLRADFINGKKANPEFKFDDIAIANSRWKEQNLVIYRTFIEPKEDLGVSYHIYLLNKDNSKIERRFMVENTVPIDSNIKNLLCEKGSDVSHFTYPFGWKSNTIPILELFNAVKDVLNQKIQVGASSNFEK